MQTSASVRVSTELGNRGFVYSNLPESFCLSWKQRKKQPQSQRYFSQASLALRLGARYPVRQRPAPGDIHLFNSPGHLRPTPISAAFAAPAGTWASGFLGSFPPSLACKFRGQGAPEMGLGPANTCTLTCARAFPRLHQESQPPLRDPSGSFQAKRLPSARRSQTSAARSAAHIPKLRRWRAGLREDFRFPLAWTDPSALAAWLRLAKSGSPVGVIWGG